MPRFRWVIAAVGLIGAGLAGLNNVATRLTPDDERFARQILTEAGYPADRAGFGESGQFDAEVKAVQAAQDAVIRVAPKDDEIPFDREREPKDLYELKQGLCYDRSRAIEKLLAVLGFEVRHVAVYATAERGALRAVMTPRNRSHALTEVKTSKGWMAVDPNVRWIGLSAEGSPLSVGDLREIDGERYAWPAQVQGRPHKIFTTSFVFIRGLYSRHGRFYPPYSPIPDVNWGQLVQNIGE